ncbi:NUDIX domain-containing protein [Nocardia sp. NPDC004860]|uniref:NUDIX domain-containing protein n=1 Tax=Nocardia sp. NPDC004860 TaxID=3154557 RepID=UPI0033AEF6FC
MAGYEDGAWHLPSGHLEADESVVAALIREADEQIGVRIAAENFKVRTPHVFGAPPPMSGGNPLEVWRLLYAAWSRDRAATEAARTAAMWVS